MRRTTIGLFGSINTAQDAVNDLGAAGFSRGDISLVSGAHTRPESGDEDLAPFGVAGLGVGAASGALLGGTTGLLAAIGVLTIPGVGPILAAGPLVAILAGAGAGAVAGAVAGGLVGVLMELGIPEHAARRYEEGIRAGGTLVAVTTDEAEEAARILKRCGAVEVDLPPREPRATQTPGRLAGVPRDTEAGPQRRAPGVAAEGTFLSSDASNLDDMELEDVDFRRHYDASLARVGESYDEYAPAYQYGSVLADELVGRDWNLSIGRIKDLWEHENPGTWDRYKTAIRYGWDHRRERP